MAPFAFTSPTIYVGAYDITADLNKIDGSYNPNFLDTTTFGSGGWRARIQGLIDVDFNAEGFNDFSSTGVDANMAPLLGSISVCTVVPNSSATAGDAAYLFQALGVGDHANAVVGEAATFALPFKGKSQMVRGYLSAPSVSRSATGSASVVQAGTASSGQVFATRHVFSSVGGNIASFIEQATNAAMINAVTRVSFSTTTATGGEWVSAAITTTAGSYWRASWVLGSTSVATFGISFAIR